MERPHLAGGSRASLRALIMSTIELGYGRGSIDFDYDAAQFDVLARPQSETRPLSDAEIGAAELKASVERRQPRLARLPGTERAARVDLSRRHRVGQRRFERHRPIDAEIVHAQAVDGPDS